MKKTIFICFISLFWGVISSNIYGAELKANVAKIDLTPPLSMKYSLGGYGARNNQPAEGVHDRIWAKALVLIEGNKKYVLVTMDMLALPPNLKPQLIQALDSQDWKEENVLLLPSHTHTSLDMTALNDMNNLNNPQLGIFHPELLEFVIMSLVKVIREADMNYHVVHVGTGSSMINGMNRNRRGDPDVDRGLTVTRIDYENGNPLAVLINWTAHPTFMDEKDMWVSGGWPGFLQTEMEQLIGNRVTVMYYNGAEGDLSPIGSKGASHYEKAEIYGRELAFKALNLYKNIDTNAEIKFEYNYEILNLPERRVHPSFMLTGGKEYNLTPEALNVVLNVMCPASTSISAIRIGDLIIVGAPGELTAGLGLHIKNTLIENGIKFPTIGGLANEWISYIMSEDQYKHGAGYESSVSFYGDGLGRLISSSMKNTSLPLISR